MYSNFNYEEKGKIFTNTVTKKPIEALIQTTLHLIRGYVHIRPEERIKDVVNQEEPFLAVTAAKIFDNQGKTLYQSRFIAVNRAQILWLMPLDDLESEDVLDE